MTMEIDCDGMNKVELYREVLPDVPSRTRQRDFADLKRLGYDVRYEKEFDGEPGKWRYDIPSAYGLTTIPLVKWD